MGHYVPEGTGEGLCDLSQAGSDTVVNDWKDWRPDTAIKAGTRCSVKMAGSIDWRKSVESALPGSRFGQLTARWPRGAMASMDSCRVRVVPEDALGVVLKQKTPRLSSA